MVAAAIPAYVKTDTRLKHSNREACTFIKSTPLTFFQGLSDLGWVSRQVKVGAVGLQVSNGTVPTSHAEALDEQLCKQEKKNLECSH